MWDKGHSIAESEQKYHDLQITTPTFFFAIRTKNILCSHWKTYAEKRNEHFDAQLAIRSHAHNARYKKISGSIIITGKPTHIPHYVANATLFNAMGFAENYSKGKCIRQILSRTRKNSIRRFAASCVQKKNEVLVGQRTQHC